MHHPLGGHLRRARDPGQGIALVAVPLLQVLKAALQGVEVEGLAVVGGEGIGNQGGGQLGLAPFQLHLGEHRIGLNRHQEPHPQRPVLGLDTHIGEPTTGVDGGEVVAQLTAGHLGARPGRHGVVNGQLEPLPFRVLLQPLHDHFTDQHLGFAGGPGLGGLAGGGSSRRRSGSGSGFSNPRFGNCCLGCSRLGLGRSNRGAGWDGLGWGRRTRCRLARTHQTRGQQGQARGESQGAAETVGTVPAVKEACHGGGESAAMPQSSADLTCRGGVLGRPLGPVCRPPRRPRPHRPGPGGNDPCPKSGRWHRPPGCSRAGRCRG